MIGDVRIAIVGLGLIGGSIARAVRGSEVGPGGPRPTIAAWSRRPDGPRTALAAGVVDAAPVELADAVEGADLVILAAPPLACLDLLDRLAGPLRTVLDPAATVTDVASTKAAIVARADALGLRFVGGHPMAGREASGFGAAESDLFVGRPWIVSPGMSAGAADIERVVWLARTCGAHPIILDPARHDALAAAISHVPLVVSAALVEAMTGRPAWPEAAGLAAGGWRDMSRLAKGDPAMGAGILATNPAQVAAGLRGVRGALDAWIAALEVPEPDAGALEARLAAVRERVVGS